MPTAELRGYTVLVTRPEHQAGSLSHLIEAAGGAALRLPALAILDNSHDTLVQQRVAHIGDYQIAIFISPNAVNFGLDAIERQGHLPASLTLATVGRGSALALEHRLGRPPDLVPQGSYDSEALLQLAPLQQVAGQAILIFRGVGGRELLAETLRARGARVDYAEVYRRAVPPPPANSDWLDKADIITFTSSEAMQNLVAMTPAALHAKLFDKPLVVVSQRCAEQARKLGFRHPPLITPLAGNEAIVQTLINWAGRPQT